jgi:hypothetical protein
LTLSKTPENAQNLILIALPLFLTHYTSEIIFGCFGKPVTHSRENGFSNPCYTFANLPVMNWFFPFYREDLSQNHQTIKIKVFFIKNLCLCALEGKI